MASTVGPRKRVAQTAAVATLLAAATTVGLVLLRGPRSHPAIRPERPEARTSTADIASTDPLLRIGLKPVRGEASGPSGAPMPTGSLHGWRLEFADDFPPREDVRLGQFSGCVWRGSIRASTCEHLPRATESRWWAYTGGDRDTSGHGVYQPGEVVTIRDRIMQFHLHTNPLTKQHVVAAVEPKLPTAERRGAIHFGAYAIRFRVDHVPGYELEFQLWPDNNNYPHDGDIALPAGYLDGKLQGVMHWFGARSVAQQTIFGHRYRDGWHTAVVQWGPHRVIFAIDGKVIGVAHSHVPQGPLHLVLQTQTDLIGPPPAATASGDVDVAWVTEYQAVPSSSSRDHTIPRPDLG